MSTKNKQSHRILEYTVFCSWQHEKWLFVRHDLWKNSGGLHSFMSSSEIFQFCTHARITEYGSIEKQFFMQLFCEKILAYITVSWNFQNYLNFLPTLQLQLRNVSQLKDNVHETHLFWKYPTYIAVLSFFKYFNFLPMLEWFKLGLLLFRLILSNGQLTKHSSNGS